MIAGLRLTRELADQVIFGMENQDRAYFLDCETAMVVAEDHVDEAAIDLRYLELPEWRSVDGYNLMERFVAGLRNPLFRERLRQILASGRGVFRQFKDTLHERPEIERRWFSFKEREMRQIVSEWFNDLREREGLERLEVVGADSETDSLIESDFTFRPAVRDDLAAIREGDRAGFFEAYETLAPEIVELLFTRSRRAVAAPDDSASRVLVAETQGGDFAGFLWAESQTGTRYSVEHVVQLFVLSDYRGLGLANELLVHYLDQARGDGVAEVIIDLPGEAMALEKRLRDMGMVSHSASVRVQLDRWGRD